MFPRKYFQALKTVFKDDCEILTISKDGQLITSVMSFYFRDEILPYYAGETTLARNFKGCNDFKYWHLDATGE